MFHFLRKIFNILSYWVLITVSVILIAGSVIISIYYAVDMGSQLSTYINKLLEAIYSAMQMPNPPKIADWLARLIFAVPFIILGLLGVVILILTERTASINAENKKLRRQIKMIIRGVSSEYLDLTVEELQKKLKDEGIKFKKHHNKIDLLYAYENAQKK